MVEEIKTVDTEAVNIAVIKGSVSNRGWKIEIEFNDSVKGLVSGTNRRVLLNMIAKKAMDEAVNLEYAASP